MESAALFQVMSIRPNDNSSNKSVKPYQLLDQLPLEEMRQKRSQIVAILYDFEAWEGDGKIETAVKYDFFRSICRKFFITEFKGIPFFGIGDTAGRWGLTYADLQCSGVSKLSAKFSEAMRDLNVGYFDNPFPHQIEAEMFKEIQPTPPIYTEDRLRRAIASTLGWVNGTVTLKAMSNGLSGARVFIASAQDKAPILIKVAPWLTAQQEYNGFQFVISPKLKNYIANIIPVGNNLGPILIHDDHKGDDDTIHLNDQLGVLAYSIVGYTSQKPNIKSLKELLQQAQHPENLQTRLKLTFKRLIAQLHSEESGLKPQQQTLWGWLGEALPIPYSAKIVTDTTKPIVLHNYQNAPYRLKLASAARLAELAWHKMWLELQQNHKQPVTLDSFVLTELDTATHTLRLRHPNLGFRIECRSTEAIKADFWVRLGMPVTVTVQFDRSATGAQGYRKLKDNTLYPQLFNSYTDTTPALPPLSLTYPAYSGTIHGDLNLDNIIFTLSEEAAETSGDSGWLIDFEKSRSDGLIAFDYAKLEIELWHHTLLDALHPLMLELDSEPRQSLITELLSDIDKSADDILPRIEQRLKAWVGDWITQSQHYPRFTELLKIHATIRQAALKSLKSSTLPTELSLALSLYAFTAIKFRPAKESGKHREGLKQIAEHYAQQWQLGQNTSLPEVVDTNWQDKIATLCENASEERQWLELDRTLVALTQKPLDYAIATLQGSVTPLHWGEQQAWDIASTGSVANITPIIGYLWLQVKRLQQSEKSIVIPKISSSGNSCGTVDILAAGGYSFTSDEEEIRERIEADGGLFCRQDEERVLVDKVTMARRKALNLMKDPKLTFASILAKKVLMGCSHAVIDIKLGRDTKLIPTHSASVQQIETLCGLSREPPNPLPQITPEQYRAAIDLLQPLLTANHLYAITANETDNHLLKLEPPENSPAPTTHLPRQLNLLFTNADTPQCRAIGRKLILIHLERLLESDTPFSDLPDKWKQLFYQQLPQALEITHPDQAQLKQAWSTLKTQLPELEQDSVIAALKRHLVDNRPSEKLLNDDNLCACTINAEHDGTITSIDANALDQLFERLSDTGIQHDPDVGIWLHKLPTEAFCKGDALLTLFYRPDNPFNPQQLPAYLQRWQQQVILVHKRDNSCA